MKTIICRKVKHKSSNPKVNCKFRLLLSVSTDSEIHHQFTHIVATDAIHHSHPQDLWLNRIDILCYRIYYANTLSANANCQRVFQKNDTRVFRIRCKLRCTPTTTPTHTHTHPCCVLMCFYDIRLSERHLNVELWKEVISFLHPPGIKCDSVDWMMPWIRLEEVITYVFHIWIEVKNQQPILPHAG